jgi:KipI family sensor histidine kinase inhibitor
VPFDPRAVAAADVEARLAHALDTMPETVDPRPEAPFHELAVRYGGDDGPDLEPVAEEVGLSPADVVELHAAATYEVLFLGFAPGFAYLGELVPALVVPRLATPRSRVPAGSVAIAGPMTAVYPHATAGGWRLLGRTDALLFDPADAPPARLRPGDRVRFVPA